MKKNVLMTVIGIGATIMLTGCGESAIKCDDSDAQGLVMEIVEETFKDQLVGIGSGGYQKHKDSANDDALKLVEEVDKRFKYASPELMNIRTENMDDKLQKSECAAEINFANGNKIDIEYKLSKTSEGDLYAEVSGL